MNVYVDFKGSIAEEDSYNLTQLAELIEKECDLLVQINKGDPQKGVKDGGLTIALSIASLGLSSIGTLISVLSYWKSQQPTYSVTITRGDTKIQIDNIAPNQLQSIATKLKAEDSSSDMKVLISGK